MWALYVWSRRLNGDAVVARDEKGANSVRGTALAQLSCCAGRGPKEFR